MFGIAKAITRRAISGPVIFDAGDAALIKGGRRFRAFLRSKRKTVKDGQHDVQRDRRGDPVGGEES